MILKTQTTAQKYSGAVSRALGVITGSTNPAVQILHLRNANDEVDQPNMDDLEYGQIAINYQKGNEKIMLKNNENEIVEIRPMDELIVDVDGALEDIRNEIDTINAGPSTAGSMQYYDNIVKEELLAEIEKFVGVSTNSINLTVSPDTREITANVKVSATENNDLTVESDGLYCHTRTVNAGTF